MILMVLETMMWKTGIDWVCVMRSCNMSVINSILNETDWILCNCSCLLWQVLGDDESHMSRIDNNFAVVREIRVKVLNS